MERGRVEEGGRVEQRGRVVVFKTPYTPLTRKLSIRTEFDNLRKDLQRSLGQGSQALHDVKAVIANPIDRCVFRDTYRLNFPVDTFQSPW